MNKDELFKRIQSLWELGNNGTNQNESNVAADMAARLIQKYNLDESEIRDWEAAPEIVHCAANEAAEAENV